MRSGILPFIAVIALAIPVACTTIQKGDITKAEWLIGTWENKTQEGSIYETWRKESSHIFEGKSYIVNGKDTVVFETIQIVQQQDGLFYVPTVKNQNGGLPVSFILKTDTETQLIFENSRHDFPQIISYTKITADSMVAEISGRKNGQERKQVFPMKRLR